MSTYEALCLGIFLALPTRMIVLGEKYLTRETHPLRPQTCPHCGRESLTLTRLAKFRHLYWIPVFPLGNRALIHCAHCHWQTDPDRPPSGLEPLINQYFSLNRRKFFFAYVSIAILLIAYLVYANKRAPSYSTSEPPIQSILERPKSSDVYIVKNAEAPHAYTYFRIEKISRDLLVIRPALHRHQTASEASQEARRDPQYLKTIYELHPDELNQMQIIAAHRP